MSILSAVCHGRAGVTPAWIKLGWPEKNGEGEEEGKDAAHRGAPDGESRRSWWPDIRRTLLGEASVSAAAGGGETGAAAFPGFGWSASRKEDSKAKPLA